MVVVLRTSTCMGRVELAAVRLSCSRAEDIGDGSRI